MEQVLSLEKPDKLFKIVPYQKPKNVLTPEETERLKITYSNCLNKANGIIVDKPNVE